MSGSGGGLRVLALLVPNTKNYRSNGTFLIVRDLWDYLRSINERVFFHWMVPDFVAEGEKDDSRYQSGCTFHSFPVVDDPLDIPYILPVSELYRMFHMRSGQYPVDLAIVIHAGTAFMAQRVLTDLRAQTKGRDFPFFVVEGGVAIDWVLANEIDYATQALGHSFGHSFFLSAREKDLARQMAGKFLKPTYVAQMLEHSTENSVGVRTDLLDEVIQRGLPKHDRFTVFFGGRLNRIKRADEILEAYDYLFRFGRPIDIVVTTGGSGYSLVDTQKYPHVRFVFGCGREEYFAEAVQAHVFLCASEREGFPVGFFEQLYLGLVGLFPDKPWTRACLPAEYPFIYRSPIELAGMLREVYNDYEAAREKIKWVPAWVRETFNHQRVLGSMWASIKSTEAGAAQRNMYWGDNFVEPVRGACLALGSSFTMGALCEKIKGSSEYGHFPALLNRHHTPGRWAVRRIAMSLGWDDTCAGAEPVFVKRGVGE